MPLIVVVNVSLVLAPVASTLQQSGALISQGATNLTANTSTTLTAASGLTSILTGAKALSSLTWSGGTVTAATTTPHGFAVSDQIELTITGATPAGYNGTFLCTITGASAFTYPEVTTLASASVPGVYTPEDVAELNAMVTTFFAQGSGVTVDILELGAGGPPDGVTALNTWIGDNPGKYYAYLIPRTWDNDSSYLAFLGTFESTTSKTYFFTTSTTGTYTNYTAAMKDAVLGIEAPGIPATEFSLAAFFYNVLVANPSPTNKVAPFSFRFLNGVTPYPSSGNGTLLASLKTAGVNWVGTGAQGGISSDILFYGTTMSVQNFLFWYAVDWAQINVALNVTNEIINGSNNPTNPLYYDQDGINRLQQRAASTMSSGVSNGLILGQVVQTQLDQVTLNANLEAGLYANQTVVNCIPFVTYTAANPADYPAGVYQGMTIVFTPKQGFTKVIIQMNVTDFVTQ